MGRRIRVLTNLFVLLPVQFACASQAAQPGAAHAPNAASDDANQPAGSVGTSSATEPRADVLYPAHAAVPAAALHCVEGLPLPPPHSCAEARDDLAEALALAPEARDTALSRLEGCADFERGLIRALRSDLGPAECADHLVEAVVGDKEPEAHTAPGQAAQSQASLSQEVREALVGLGLAARLRRLATETPTAPEARDKATLDTYYKETLFPWIEKQAGAIFSMASQGKQLHGYGKGLVAIEAGNADMRFVEIARDAPIAEEIAKFQEARDLYYATLDESLEPRKGRGAAAALVGLRLLAQLGIRSDERVSSARQLLSRAYGGRRINALDTLLVPPLAAEQASDAASAIASRVPSVYATALVNSATVSAAAVRAAPISDQLVRAHVQMGMPIALRRAIQSGDAGPLSQLYLARALFEQGRTYFRAQDFQDAHQVLNGLLDAESPAESGPSASSTTQLAALTEEQRQEALLLRGLCIALLAGPKDAAEMIAQGPRFAEALGNLVILDGLAEGQTTLAGRAAFNAAYLRELVVRPGNADAWKDLASRYAGAAKRLQGTEARWARERSASCKEIEKNVRAQLKKP